MYITIPLVGNYSLMINRSEKVDGSLANMYYYDNKWHVSSSSLPDASGTISGSLTISGLFWEIWKSKGYMMPKYQTTSNAISFS